MREFSYVIRNGIRIYQIDYPRWEEYVPLNTSHEEEIVYLITSRIRQAKSQINDATIVVYLDEIGFVFPMNKDFGKIYHDCQDRHEIKKIKIEVYPVGNHVTVHS